MKKTVLVLLLGLFTAGAFAVNNFDILQKKRKNAKMAMKAHVCTAACKNGMHVYAHSEKGHICGPECIKTKM